MRKIFLYFLAAFILTSCDNLKKKDKSDSDDEEVTSKKKKKPLDEETDEEETPKKKKTLTKTDDEETPTTNKDEETDDTRITNYSKGWSTTEKNTFMSTCVEKASTGMGQTRAENYCSCMLNKIEELYPNSNDAGKLTEQKTTQLAKECLGQ